MSAVSSRGSAGFGGLTGMSTVVLGGGWPAEPEFLVVPGLAGGSIIGSLCLRELGRAN